MHFSNTANQANFEVVFYENTSSFFDIFYGVTVDNGSDETSGVQASATGPATTYSCGTAYSHQRLESHLQLLHTKLDARCEHAQHYRAFGWRLFPG